MSDIQKQMIEFSTMDLVKAVSAQSRVTKQLALQSGRHVKPEKFWFFEEFSGMTCRC